MRTLIVDINNMAFVTRFSLLGQPKTARQKDKNAMLVIFKGMLNLINQQTKLHKCTNILIACDGRNVWRKDIYPDYKASSTTKEDFYYGDTLEAADKVKELFKELTAAMVLEVARCEADDLIGYWCKNTDTEVVILSTDGDYIQLLTDKVKLYSPTKKKYIESEDPSYDLFLKCIRGDKNDTIRSAYPRVRETVIKEAWDCDLAMLNFLETIRKDGVKVGEVFDLNQKLIDLTEQPDYIKLNIKNTINEYSYSKFDQVAIMKRFFDLGLKDGHHEAVTANRAAMNQTRINMWDK